MMHVRKRLSAMLVFALMFGFIPYIGTSLPVAHAATDYYITTTGVDSAGRNGSSSQPWKTLSYAATRVPADMGNTINVGAGTFVETSRTILPTGVNVIGQGVGTTMIKSGFFYTGNRNEFAENYFLIEAASTSQTDGNQTLSGFTLDGDLRQTHGGIVFRHRNNVTVHDIAIQNFDWNGFWTHRLADNFQMYNVTFTNTAWGDSGYVSGALQLGDLTNSTIHDITINEDVGYGIKSLSWNNTTFENVTFYNLDVNVPAHGAWNNGSAPNISMEIQAATIKNVEVYDSYFNNTVSLVGWSFGTNPTIRFHHNTVDAHNGYALEMDYDYMEVDHNYLYGGRWLFAAWGPHRTNQSVHHNTVYDLTGTTEYPVQLFRYANGVDNLKIYNNTFQLNQAFVINGVEMQAGTSANLEIKNNIFWSTGTTGSVIVDPNNRITSKTVDNNLFYNYSGASLGSNNLTVAPQLTAAGNRPSPYYIPASGSPVIDAGVDVGFAYSGSAPDIGAYEYGGSPPPDPDHAVPGTIQAEDYSAMSGVQTQSTTDTGGGQNVGWIDTGDWMDYSVDVAEAGSYTVQYRVASPNAAGQIQLKSGSAVLATTNVPNTGGWQTWTTVSATVNLSAGAQTIRIHAGGGGFNLNWFSFASGGTGGTVTINDTVTGTGQNQFEYVGTWGSGPATDAYQDDDHYSDTTNDYYQVRFTGTQIKVYSQKYFSMGIVAISIDGGAETNVDAYNATKLSDTLLYTSPVLTDGSHTLKVRLTGTKNASSVAYYHVADRVEITTGGGSSPPTPTVVQAESYSAMSGIQTETTTDTGGGQDVGWIDTGDWMEYSINPDSAGSYAIEYRVASPNSSGQIQFKTGSTVLATTNVPNTGGWQTWTTVSATVNLSAGAQTIRIHAGGGGFNLNWFSFVKQ